VQWDALAKKQVLVRKSASALHCQKPEHACISDYLGGNINQRVEAAHAEVHIYNSFCGHKYVGIYLAGAKKKKI